MGGLAVLPFFQLLVNCTVAAVVAIGRLAVFAEMNTVATLEIMHLPAAPTLGWVYNNVWFGKAHADGQYLVYTEPGVGFENDIVANTVGGGIKAYSPVNGITYNHSIGNSGDDGVTNSGDAPPSLNINADPRFVDPATGIRESGRRRLVHV